jgi:hypothetical protein
MSPDDFMAFIAAIGALVRIGAGLGVFVFAIASALGAWLDRPKAPPPPRRAQAARPDRSELERILYGSVGRGYYRSLVAERLRALARDALVLRSGLGEEDAAKRLRFGASFLDDEGRELLFADHFGRPKARAERSAGRSRRPGVSNGLAPATADRRTGDSPRAQTAEPDFPEAVSRFLDKLEDYRRNDETRSSE